MPAGRDLSGRAALVTGAGRGIGRAIALRLAADGAAVAVNDIEASAKETCEQIIEAGGLATPVLGDVSSEPEVSSFVELAVRELGRLDILVNNAGIFPWRAWTEIPVEEWDRVMAVNVRGAFLCARCSYPHLRQSGHGRVVNVSSTTWLSGPRHLLHYATSKAALVGLTHSLARELGDDNITVNAVATGRTLTEGVRDWIAAGHMTLDDVVESRQVQPIKRVGEPEEVAAVVSFLASDDASYMTGEIVVVDGGRNMH